LDRIAVTGGHRLEGSLAISGAKNAALPLMCAGMLTAYTLTLSNLPHLADIKTLKALIEGHGATTNIDDEGKNLGEGQVISFKTPAITNTVAPYDIVRKMRASILVLGPLLARTGEATVSLPGGCAIGNRPIDLHLKGFEAMGANIELDEGYVRAVAPGGRLKGGTVVFPTVSVGATENILMAAYPR
jgi:UDP-N-acetylglucosamine 1-carboxyvinyltransferase